MKTFEEKLAAWLDGRLTGNELAAFERELESHPEAIAETDADIELGNLLRANLSKPPLRNADFFNLQILRQIDSFQPPVSAPPSPRLSFWTLRRMAFSGFSLLLLATGLYFAAVPKTRRDVQQEKTYVERTLNPDSKTAGFSARSDEPGITATAFHSKQDNADVVWLDGLNYMPPDHKLR